MESIELPIIPLSVETVHSPRMIGTIADLKFQFKVTNHSKETITLVRDPSGILSSRYRTEKFIVTTSKGNIAHAHFRGIRIKWSPEKAAELGDTVVIAPGQSNHSVIEQDLSRTYDFTVPGEGSYTFTPKNFFYVVDPVSREIKYVKAESVPAVSVTLSGELVIRKASAQDQPQNAPVTKLQDIEIVGGTPEQHARVENASREAQDYIFNCNRYLDIAPSGTPHYETWFGAFNAGLMETVKSIYTRINGGPMTARYDLDTCADASSYAYVISDDPTKTIYLCPLFWSAPLTGINSQAGTIVHELTHFEVNGGTWDWAYGVVACRLLAIAARHLAVNNADSFEYFAEVMGSMTASGLFIANNGGFNATFVTPESQSTNIFTGRFNEAAPQFNSSQVVLVYDDVKNLTGTYDIQAGSVVGKKNITLRLKNEAGKELMILANLSPSLDTSIPVTGNGNWN